MPPKIKNLCLFVVAFVPDLPKFKQTNMEVHMNNKGVQNAPPPEKNGTASPSGEGTNPPPKWKLVRHGHRIYRTATKINPNMSVRSTTLAAQCPPTRAASPLFGA